ncbi:hypothetical protein KI387_026413, partial [Taxus chinensis]
REIRRRKNLAPANSHQNSQQQTPTMKITQNMPVQVDDDGVSSVQEKSDLKDSIHLHHEPIEGQEGSMSLMVTPSHFLHDTSIGEGEKGGLDEENNGGKSVVLNSEILSFVDVRGSPRCSLCKLQEESANHLFLE